MAHVSVMWAACKAGCASTPCAGNECLHFSAGVGVQSSLLGYIIGIIL